MDKEYLLLFLMGLDAFVCSLFTCLLFLCLSSSFVLVLGATQEAVWPGVRAFALRSGDPGFKTRSNHSLNLILVVPGSTSQLHL